MIFSMSTANLINFFFIAMGIGVCGLCFMQITSSKHLRKEIRRYFQVFFLTLIVYISTHLARQLMDGLTGNGIRTALYIVTFLIVLAAGFMAFMVSILVLTTSRAEKIEKQFQIILLALLGVHTILLIANLFGNFIYYFDESNLYHRGWQYILSNLCPLVMMLIDSYLLFRYKDNIAPRVRSAFWIYLIAPIAAIAIQSFTYGIQFIIFATVGAAVNMFSVIIREQNERYEHQQKETARLSTELDLASQIQHSALPEISAEFSGRKEFVLAASMDPAKWVGGDFYDFFYLDENRLALVIADVSGKGIPAALFMMSAKNKISVRASSGGTPAEILTDVNLQLCRNNHTHMFVTVWLGILDLRTGVISACNAGHEEPAIRGKDGVFRLYQDPHGFVLGGRKRSKYTDYEIKLNPGDTIFVYTDGITEAADDNQTFYEDFRMVEALNQPGLTGPDEIIAAMKQSVQSFANGAEQADDLTMLCLLYRGPNTDQSTETAA